MATTTSINDQILKSVKSLTTNKSTSNKLQSDLNLQTVDWLQLLVAQLKNQDMNNTMDAGEMIGQMAQFTQIQSIQSMVSMQENMVAMNTTSYAASLIGKEVTVAEVQVIQNSDGSKVETLVTKKGVITGVTLFEGQPIVYIGEKPYSLSQIMIVGEVPDNPADVKPPEPGEGDGGGETTKPGEGDGETVKPGEGDGETVKPGDGDGSGDTVKPGTDDGNGESGKQSSN